MNAQLANTPVLETERLILRAPGPQDMEAAVAFFTTARAQYVGGGAGKDQTNAFRVMAIICGHWVLNGFGPFIGEDRATKETVGAFGPWYPTAWPEREIGWSLWRPEYEGKGLAAEAARAAIAYAYSTLGWDTAVSYIVPNNTASQAVALRLGATLDKTATPPDPGTLVFRHPRVAK